MKQVDHSTGRCTVGQCWSILHMAAIISIQPTRRNILHWISWAVVLCIWLSLVVILQHDEIYMWEQNMTRFLQSIPVDRTVFDVTNFLTNTISVWFVVLFLIIAGVLIGLGHRLEAGLLLLTFPLHVLAQAPKVLVDRPRPSAAFPSIEGVGGFQSFPSGHAEYVITFYGFLTIVMLSSFPRRWQRVVALLILVLFVLMVGLGRIVLGRHWPLDVFASYIVGAGILSGILWLRWSIKHATTEVTAENPVQDCSRQLSSGG